MKLIRTMVKEGDLFTGCRPAAQVKGRKASEGGKAKETESWILETWARKSKSAICEELTQISFSNNLMLYSIV